MAIEPVTPCLQRRTTKSVELDRLVLFFPDYGPEVPLAAADGVNEIVPFSSI